MVKEMIVMFRKLRPLLSAGIAAILAVEAAVQPVFSAEEQTIETISFSNVSTSLTIGTARGRRIRFDRPLSAYLPGGWQGDRRVSGGICRLAEGNDTLNRRYPPGHPPEMQTADHSLRGNRRFG